MTAEELAEVLRAVNANRPHVTQTMNFNGPIGQQIAHVDKIEAHFDKDMGMQVVNVEETTGAEPVADAQTAEEELFHFIHPDVTIAEEQSIHQAVKRLVRRYGVQEICSYLSELADQHKVLLPVGVQTAYDELARMGMPSGEKGFDYKTFAKYYRK